MSHPSVQPFPQPLGPVATRWWQKPVVAVATVVVVTGLTGGVAYAATRGDSAAGTQDQVQFPGGGTFPGNGPTGQQGQTQQGQTQQGQTRQGQTDEGTPGRPSQTSRGANSPTT